MKGFTFFFDYLRLTKWRISLFALISAWAGYSLALKLETAPVFFSVSFPLLYLMVGLYFVMSGSFAINQVYEWRLDSLMNRTKNRPIPSGRMTTLQAFSLGIVQTIFGLLILLALNPLSALLALLAFLLYNICYTIFWKKTLSFAAVLGALPGALPVMIGYSVVSSSIFSLESLYLFLILFLWQMPHFWSLALHYKKDYQLASVPVLPLRLGDSKTIYYIGIYLLSYLGLVLISPLLFPMNFIYALVIIPICIKLFLEFVKFSKKLGKIKFFIWLNGSILIFLWAPVWDFWIYSWSLHPFLP